MGFAAEQTWPGPPPSKASKAKYSKAASIIGSSVSKSKTEPPKATGAASVVCSSSGPKKRQPRQPSPPPEEEDDGGELSDAPSTLLDGGSDPETVFDKKDKGKAPTMISSVSKSKGKAVSVAGSSVSRSKGKTPSVFGSSVGRSKRIPEEDEGHEEEEKEQLEGQVEDENPPLNKKGKPKALPESVFSFSKGKSRIPSEVGSSASSNAGKKMKEGSIFTRGMKKLGMIPESEAEDEDPETGIPRPPRAESIISKASSHGSVLSEHNLSALDARDCGNRSTIVGKPSKGVKSSKVGKSKVKPEGSRHMQPKEEEEEDGDPEGRSAPPPMSELSGRSTRVSKFDDPNDVVGVMSSVSQISSVAPPESDEEEETAPPFAKSHVSRSSAGMSKSGRSSSGKCKSGSKHPSASRNRILETLKEEEEVEGTIVGKARNRHSSNSKSRHHNPEPECEEQHHSSKRSGTVVSKAKSSTSRPSRSHRHEEVKASYDPSQMQLVRTSKNSSHHEDQIEINSNDGLQTLAHRSNSNASSHKPHHRSTNTYENISSSRQVSKYRENDDSRHLATSASSREITEIHKTVYVDNRRDDKARMRKVGDRSDKLKIKLNVRAQNLAPGRTHRVRVRVPVDTDSESDGEEQ